MNAASGQDSALPSNKFLQTRRNDSGHAAAMPRIAYIVHDLHDPAVARRVRMLQAAGEEVVVAGFYRGSAPPTRIAGAETVPLARTADARLAQRTIAVLRNLIFSRRLLAATASANVIVGRNLEALALAHRARMANRSARLVYECLDIHRLLEERSLPARLVQRIEARLLRTIDLLIVSSPAFVRDHFSRRPTLRAAILLVENKLLALGPAKIETPPSPSSPPWTIGWLGNLRCRKTFDVLAALVRRHRGRVRLLVAGRPTTAVFPDLAAELAGVENCEYLGPYTPDQQSEIYGRCHFVWAIDWFEEGLNSKWLLPNRLYEAQAFGTVPIALASVETGRWLADHRTGILLGDDLDELDTIFSTLNDLGYDALRNAVECLPRSDIIADESDCADLAMALLAR